MVFIDLEMAYDKAPMEILWWTLTMKDISQRYVTSLRTCMSELARVCESLLKNRGVPYHDWSKSRFCTYFFSLCHGYMEEMTSSTIPWCMLFVDDILLVDETKEGGESKLEL